MGMAAGQARLLSITSRMSDNELRAQLINNSKMRLATESSKASEAYVAALNETQMMFTNYGPDDTSSYQELTFNSLTAYNPYNNQYALSNASGQVLVSEKDAQNYVNANGSLDRFLESYGLTKGTTYFDELAKSQLADDGTVIGIGYTPDELKSMYYGTNDHQGYQALLTSDSYFQYQQHNEAINSLYETMMDEAWGNSDSEGIRGIILGGLDNTYKINGLSYNDFIKDTADNDKDNENYIANYYAPRINDFLGYLDSTTGVLVNGANNKVYTETKEILTSALEKFNLNASNAFKYNNTTGVEIQETSDCEVNGNIVVIDIGGTNLNVEKKNETYTYNDPVTGEEKVGTRIVYNAYVKDDDGNNINFNETGIKATISGGKVIYTEQEMDPNTDTPNGKNSYVAEFDINTLFNGTDHETITHKSTYYKAELESELQTAFENAQQYWDANIKYNIDPAAFPSVPQTAAYIEECEKYAKFLFGDNCLAADGGHIQTSDYTSLLTLEGIQHLLTIYPEPQLTISDDFSNVLELLTLENMMDLYGEPKVSWLDSTDTNGSGNAEKKAQWYTNLFERMGNGVKNNFKVLGNGLASSQEWIKFALENGIVTMEQINTSNEWKTVMYSNVSDITEKTSDAAVTKAEAEYKRAMNKIETKDKQYDLELKNIDTEHNSLQTEYDSIKSAIDKNVERTFKLYS